MSLPENPIPMWPTPAARRPPTRRPPGRRLVVGVIAGTLALLGLIVATSAASSGFDKTTGGEIAVVRNGGPLDNNRIRQIVDPGSSLTWVGLFSSAHKYPSQQRFYTITADTQRGEKAGIDVEHVPTSDGVEVGIEGTIYFSLNLDHAALRRFDDKYGTRKFRGLDGAYRYAWESDAGWSTFLDQVVRPVISNDLREQIGNFRCGELVSSCALVQNNGAAQAAAQSVKGTGNVNIAKIQQALNTSLLSDLTATLDGPFINGIRVSLARVTLPTEVQAAVNRAQAAFAQVTEAQARIASAKADAQANEARQRGYVACPACAAIDQLKAIPPNVTTYAPGAGFAVTPSAPKP